MPTVYFNVPRGFDMLITACATTTTCAAAFFREVKFAFYAGAALPQISGTRWKSFRSRPWSCAADGVGLGLDRTSPLATDCHFQAKRSGNIGVPIPGTELKLVPSGDKHEVRVRGPNVTPGYWKAPELTAQAFDSEGFYLIGDAVNLRRPGSAGAGVCSSTAALPRISSSIPAPGSASAPCALRA